MKQVLPVIIICSVGILACLAYIVYVVVRALRRKPPKPRTNKNRNEFEIEDDTLIIKLGRKKK